MSSAYRSLDLCVLAYVIWISDWIFKNVWLFLFSPIIQDIHIYREHLSDVYNRQVIYRQYKWFTCVAQLMYSDVWAIYAYYCTSNTKKFITLQVLIQFTRFLCHCSLCFLLFKLLHWLCKCVPVNSQSSCCCMAFAWKIHNLFSFYCICLIFMPLLILISVFQPYTPIR